MQPFTRLLRSWLLPFLLATPLLFSGLLAYGQTNAYYQPIAADSARGYWRVNTDYNSRMTRVSFYTAQHELLYQEKIMDRYVKLTKRTVRQFDKLLAKLVDRHLVADRIKSYDLLASNRRFDPPQDPQTIADEQNRAMPVASSDQLSVHLMLINGKKLKLSYLNTTQQRLLITIADDSFRHLYSEKSTLSSDDKLFDISRLASGTYWFEVDSGHQKVRYKLVIPDNIGQVELKRVALRTNH